MAEFLEVMRQGKRLCERCGECESCPIFNAKISCPVVCYEDDRPIADVERIIMDWAAEHPEVRYPTWAEWADSNFPNAYVTIVPCAFTVCPIIDKKCSKSECLNISIPADIAQKLGIQPITGKE